MDDSPPKKGYIRRNISGFALVLCLPLLSCSGDAPKKEEKVEAPIVAPSVEQPSPSQLPAAEQATTTSTAVPTPAQKFVEVYDPETQTFVKAVELEGGDTIPLAEWNRVWDPKDPNFSNEIGNRFSRFSGGDEIESSGGTVTVDRPQRKRSGVVRVTHCSKTSGRLRRRG